MSEVPKRTRARANSPEAREVQLTALAYDLAEQQLRDKTASSQVIKHFLDKGSARDKLELERLREENKLLRAKTESIKDSKRVEGLLVDAMAALRSYSIPSGGSDEPV